MKSILLQVRLNQKTMSDIDNLAGAANLNRSEYVKLWLGAISRLKRERAIDGIAAIPKHFFKGLPGRPTNDDSDEEPGEAAEQ